VRLIAGQVPEALIAVSFSKNLGLYRERAGALTVIGENENRADASLSHVLQIARSIYSMPPDHGAAIAAHIFANPHSRVSGSRNLPPCELGSTICARSSPRAPQGTDDGVDSDFIRRRSMDMCFSAGARPLAERQREKTIYSMRTADESATHNASSVALRSSRARSARISLIRVSHGGKFLEPLTLECRVRENVRRYCGPMVGRHRIDAASDLQYVT